MRLATSNTVTPSRLRCRWRRSENKSGKFVKPDLESGQKALAGVELPANLRAWITDPRAALTPIRSSPTPGCFATRNIHDPKTAQTLKSVIKYGLSQGQSFSADLGYIPLPAATVDQVTKALDQIS